jgi:hypothetical protein
MARDMGLGELAGANLVFKRKYRWTFQVVTNAGDKIDEYFVKLASRPNVTIEETEINFLNGKMYIPGKATWETITVTYYDIGNAGKGIVGLYTWLANVYDFTNPTKLQQSSKRGISGSGGGYAAEGLLNLYDGCGNSMETWKLFGLWPQAINFGELDYSSSEEVTIELTLRYDKVLYINECGGNPAPSCVGCT